MNQWKVILAALVIFAAGAGTGALTMKLNQPPITPTASNPIPHRNLEGTNSVNNPPRPGPPGPPGPERHAQFFVQRMQEKLNLTPEQTQRVLTIMTNSQERMKMEFASVQELINKELTPEQMEKFKEAFSRDRRRGGDGERGERGDRGDRDGRDWDKDKRSRDGEKPPGSNDSHNEPKKD